MYKAFYNLFLVLTVALFLSSCESNDALVTQDNGGDPVAPVLQSPPNNLTIVSTSPVLDWNNMTGAYSYSLQISRSADFIASLVDVSGLQSSEYAIPQGILSDSSKYYWRVSADLGTAESPWSDPFSFSVLTTSAVSNKVLIELFTNTSCIPCVSANRYLDNIHMNMGTTIKDSNVVLLRYHTSLYPNDPFYNYNVPDNNVRQQYYNSANANPKGFLLGTFMGNYNQSSWTNAINAKLSVNRNYGVRVTNDYNVQTRTGSLTAEVNQVSGQQQSNLVVFFAVAEDQLFFNGQNGETIFENTFRNFIGGSSGDACNISAGQSVSFSKTYNISNAINDAEGYIVVFVQNLDTKEIFAVEKINLR